MSTETLRRPLMRYHGGKWRLAKWIIPHFPGHLVYVEPFGGSAAVLLQKPRSRSEIYNDVDGDAVNLFNVLRSAPSDLALALMLTPYARAEYAVLYEPCDDAIERARRFVARSFMGANSKGAYRRSGFDARLNDDHFVSRLRSLANLPSEISAISGRLINVLIEQCDALELIARYDTAETLFYVDPPYFGTRNYYAHNFAKKRHAELIEALRGVSAMVVLSGYACPLYDGALQGWKAVSRAARVDTGRDRNETLWLNPAAQGALAAAA